MYWKRTYGSGRWWESGVLATGAECTAISLENSHTSWLSVQVFRDIWESVYLGGCGAAHSRARLLICLAFRGTSESRNYWQDLEHHRTVRSLERNVWESNAFHAALVYLFALICICYFNDLMPSTAPTRRRFHRNGRGIDSSPGQARAPNGVRSPIHHSPFPNPRWLHSAGIFLWLFGLVLAGRKLLGRFFTTSFPYQIVWILRINHLIKNNNAAALAWWITSALVESELRRNVVPQIYCMSAYT